jgi:hypothetical protein
MLKLLATLSLLSLFLFSTPKPPRETISPLTPSPTLQTPAERISEIFAGKELTPESDALKLDLYKKFQDQDRANTASEKNKKEILDLMADSHSQELKTIKSNIQKIQKTYTLKNFASRPHGNIAKLYRPTFLDIDHKNYAEPFLALFLTPSPLPQKINQNILPEYDTKTSSMTATYITQDTFILTWIQHKKHNLTVIYAKNYHISGIATSTAYPICYDCCSGEVGGYRVIGVG